MEEMPIKEHLYVHDVEHLSVHEDFVVFGEYRVEDYLHGRCHLMALAIREQTGLQCGVMLDLEAGYDADDEPVAALDHAFCELEGSMTGYVHDARGVRSRVEIQREYNEAFEPEQISGIDAENLIRQWIASGRLEDFLPGEQEALGFYVKELQQYPCMVILPVGSSWHSFEASGIPATTPFFNKTNAISESTFDLG
ncbi:hypothetical protein [Pseudomonas serbica]|uniref:hypothetical protein n=1 Tax=Pseudomonas serbica TaxID=2965074 RepID=UPI00237B7DAC|nr:hypothetical protein [Pseudomonas serbica]